MVNEAVIIELLGFPKGLPIRYTIAAGTSGTDINELTLMKITDPRTIVVTAADNDPFAGILVQEHEGGTSATTASVYTFGIFDLKLTTATTAVGDKLSVGGTNLVSKVAAADLLFADVGTGLEAGSNDEVIAVLVTPGA